MNQPTAHDKQRRVAILALPGFVPFDLGIPLALFSRAELPDGCRPYDVFLAGPCPEVPANSGVAATRCLPLDALYGSDMAGDAGTVVIPGLFDPFAYRDEAVFEALRRAAGQGTRLASICTGACVLAAAGLLDGLRAATHWEIAPELQVRYPAVTVEEEILFVDNGQVLASAGLAAGIDLCLHMIRTDCGAATAAACAEFFVVPVERDGCQSQRVRRPAPQDRDSLAALQVWLLENLHLPLSARDMADRAAMSLRTLNRKFREQTGAAPMLWLTRARVRRAQALLEASTLSVEQVAAAVGFGSPASFRDNFHRLAGVSPTAWRRTYGK